MYVSKIHEYFGRLLGKSIKYLRKIFEASCFLKRVKAKHAFLIRTFLSFSAKKMSQFQSQMPTTPTGHSYTQQVNVFYTKFLLKIV